MDSPLKILDVQNVLSTYTHIPSQRRSEICRWLPLYKDSKLEREFAYMIGKSFGDGHLDARFTYKHSGPKYDLIELKRYLIATYKFEDASIVIYDNSKYSRGTVFLLQINNSFFGRILYLLGAPIGNKTTQKTFIPKWIFSNKKNSRYFLMGLFEDELTTIKIVEACHCGRIMIKMTKNKDLLDNLSKFLNQVKIMTENQKVECCPVSVKPISGKDNTKAELYLSIKRNKSNIHKFRENIGFKVYKKKISELETCCKLIKNK
jgi:hypothetical protein